MQILREYREFIVRTMSISGEQLPRWRVIGGRR